MFHRLAVPLEHILGQREDPILDPPLNALAIVGPVIRLHLSEGPKEGPRSVPDGGRTFVSCGHRMAHFFLENL